MPDISVSSVTPEVCYDMRQERQVNQCGPLQITMRTYSIPYFGPAHYFHVAATCQVSNGCAPPGASPPSGSTYLPST